MVRSLSRCRQRTKSHANKVIVIWEGGEAVLSIITEVENSMDWVCQVGAADGKDIQIASNFRSVINLQFSSSRNNTFVFPKFLNNRPKIQNRKTL